MRLKKTQNLNLKANNRSLKRGPFRLDDFHFFLITLVVYWLHGLLNKLRHDHPH